jgi:hypothetical protein
MFKPIYLILILALILFCLLTLYAFKHLSQGWSFKVLFKEFNRKMWMTLCLGGLFLGLYLLIVGIGMYLTRQMGTDLFFLAYRHPISFVYGGLWLFICLSFSIYLARMVIKYFYLTKGKD